MEDVVFVVVLFLAALLLPWPVAVTIGLAIAAANIASEAE